MAINMNMFLCKEEEIIIDNRRPCYQINDVQQYTCMHIILNYWTITIECPFPKIPTIPTAVQLSAQLINISRLLEQLGYLLIAYSMALLLPFCLSLLTHYLFIQLILVIYNQHTAYNSQILLSIVRIVDGNLSLHYFLHFPHAILLNRTPTSIFLPSSSFISYSYSHQNIFLFYSLNFSKNLLKLLSANKVNMSAVQIFISLLLIFSLQLVPVHPTVISTPSTIKLQLNYPATIIETNRQWSRVKLSFNNIAEPSTINYDEYPESWYQVLNYVYIPSANRKVNRKYPCKITLTDRNGLTYKATVVFFCSNSKLFLSDVLFDYDEVFDDQFFNTDIFSGKPILVKDSTGPTSTLAQKSKVGSSRDQDLEVQKNAVDKMDLVSKSPGAGIYNLLDGLSSSKQTVSLTSLLSSIKLKQQLKGSAQSKISPPKQDPTKGINVASEDIKPKNIQQAAKNSLSGQYRADIAPVYALNSPEETLNLGQIQSSGPVNLFKQQKFVSGVFAPSSPSLTASSFSSSTSTSTSTSTPALSTFSSSSSSSSASLPFTTPNFLSPNTPNILDNPNLTANQKQQILLQDIKKTQIQEKSQTQSIQSFFFKLPGAQQLDSIILTSDQFAILKTIQSVIQSDLDCEQKISYLSDFLGRIQSAISLKAFSAAQLTVIVQTAQENVIRLQKEIEQNKKAMQDLGVQDKRNKLSEALFKLEDAYSSYNNVEVQIENKQAQITALSQQIELSSTTSSTNSQITIQKLRLSQVTNQISLLSSQYAEAVGRRSSIESNVGKLTQSIQISENSITTSQKRIQELQKQRTVKSTATSDIKIKYQALEISIERQRTEIATRQKKISETQLLLRNLEERLSVAQTKGNNIQIGRLQSFVSQLEIITRNVTVQIDDVSFRCNLINQYTGQNTNSTIIYEIPAREYTNYLQNIYQYPSPTTKLNISLNLFQNPTQNLKSQIQSQIQSKIQSVSKVKISPVTILDNTWLTTFGNPYSDTSYTKAKQFYFFDDFQCGEQSKLQSGTGTIKNINKKIIQVINGNTSLKLNLGACSRMEVTNSVPKIGQKIYYRAQKVANSEFNLYKASCL